MDTVGPPNLPDLGRDGLGAAAWAYVREHGLYRQTDGSRPPVPPEYRQWVAEKVCVGDGDAGGLSSFDREADDSWVQTKQSGASFRFGQATWVRATDPRARCVCTPRGPCACCAPESEREDGLLLHSIEAGAQVQPCNPPLAHPVIHPATPSSPILQPNLSLGHQGDRNAISIQLTARAAFVQGTQFYEGRWVVP